MMMLWTVKQSYKNKKRARTCKYGKCTPSQRTLGLFLAVSLISRARSCWWNGNQPPVCCFSTTADWKGCEEAPVEYQQNPVLPSSTSTDSALTFLRPDECWQTNSELAFHKGHETVHMFLKNIQQNETNQNPSWTFNAPLISRRRRKLDLEKRSSSSSYLIKRCSNKL